MKTAALFVDIQNIYYTTRQAFGRSFNYRKLLEELNSSEDHNLIHLAAYAINSKDDGQIKFQDALKHMGFTLSLKPFIQRADGSAKGDWDVGITLDIIEIAPTVDRIILLSGDGDFDLLLKKVKKSYGTESIVYGVPGLTAQSLIDSADRYLPITEKFLI